jgi:hypothetical protein
MNAEDFYYKEKCEDSEKYDKTPIDNWWFGEHEMILFAEEYHKAKLKLLNIDSVVVSEVEVCPTCKKLNSIYCSNSWHLLPENQR